VISDDGVGDDRDGGDGEPLRKTQPPPSSTAPENRKDSTSGIKNQNKPSLRYWPVIKEALEAVSLLAVIVTMIFVGLQWQEMGRQYKIMNDQLTDARKAAAESRKDTDRLLTAAEKQAAAMTESIGPATTSAAHTAADGLAETKKSNGTAAAALGVVGKQLEVTDRAWLKPEIVVASPLTWSAAGAHIDIEVGWKNVGRSTANRAMTSMRIVAPAMNKRVELAREVQEECRMAEIMPKSDYPLGSIVWPGEPAVIFKGTFDIPSAQIAANPAWRHTKEWPGEYWQPYFVGCVAYRLINSGRLHYTTFAYEIVRLLPSHHPGVTLIEIGKDVPAEDVVLRKDSFEGNGAN